MAIVLEVGQQIIVHSADVFCNDIRGTYPLLCTVVSRHENESYTSDEGDDDLYGYVFSVPYHGDFRNQSSRLCWMTFDVIQREYPEGI